MGTLLGVHTIVPWISLPMIPFIWHRPLRTYLALAAATAPLSKVPRKNQLQSQWRKVHENYIGLGKSVFGGNF